jgi:hypothetical protein
MRRAPLESRRSTCFEDLVFTVIPVREATRFAWEAISTNLGLHAAVVTEIASLVGQISSISVMSRRS